MKKVLLLLMASAVLMSCSKGYVIDGTVTGVADGTKITLEKQQESLGYLVTIDTTTVKDGKFTFKGKKVDEPGLYQIAIDSIRTKSLIVLENEEITINIDKDNVLKNKVGGSYNNDQLTEYSANISKIQQKVMDFQKANEATMKEVRAKKDTAAAKKLFAEHRKIKDEVRDELMAFQKKYTDSHPKAFISLILIQTAMAYPNANIQEIKERYDNLDASLKKTNVGKNIEKKLEELKVVNVGRRAPDFTAPDVNGKPVSLKESIGRITIIDFWASWCPPCRKENPNMVALYKDFHDKGVNIIGVSLDKDADKWKEAIAKDGLAWTQVSNLKYWDDPIVAQYGVKAVPATYVLNQYGVVVAKDLSGEALRKKIVEMLEPKKAPMMNMPMPKPPAPATAK